MNISEPFIRRPVMTTLVMLSILFAGIAGYRLLPVSDLPNVDFPNIVVTANVPGASPGDHGLGGGHAPGEAVLDHRGHRLHDVGQRPGAHADQHSVQPEPQHRRRRPGRELGDSRRAAAASPEHAEPAVVPQGEPGGPAGALPCPQLPHAAAFDRGRLRPDPDRPARLDDQRGCPGPGLRFPEVRGARAAESPRACRQGDRDRRGGDGGRPRERRTSRRERSTARTRHSPCRPRAS